MKQYKYLVVDKDYGIYGLEVLSGRVRSLVKRGELSLIRLRDNKGMNIDGSFVDFDPYTPAVGGA